MIEIKEEGETLIKKVQRIMDENEPLKDGAPLIYTPKQAGVRADCDIRTDKWDIAMKAMNRVNEYKLSEYLKEGPTETPAQKAYRDWETDRKSTRLNSSHRSLSRMPSSA